MPAYSFRITREYSQRKYQRLTEYVHDAHAIFDILQQCPERPIPIAVPLLGHIMTFNFEEPLSVSVLEKLASEGYKCINMSTAKMISDKAAE